eukprot:UN09493
MYLRKKMILEIFDCHGSPRLAVINFCCYHLVCKVELSLEMNFQLHLMTREIGSHIILHFLDIFLLSVSDCGYHGKIN